MRMVNGTSIPQENSIVRPVSADVLAYNFILPIKNKVHRLYFKKHWALFQEFIIFNIYRGFCVSKTTLHSNSLW